GRFWSDARSARRRRPWTPSAGSPSSHSSASSWFPSSSRRRGSDNARAATVRFSLVPGPERAMDQVRVAAVGDIHCTNTSEADGRAVLEAASRAADVLLLCGDLTDYGLADEARVLAAAVRAGLRIPALAVLGNHDHESGQQDEVKRILTEAGIVILD